LGIKLDKLYIPRFLYDLVHYFRITLHPRYSDEAHDTGVLVRCTVEDVRERLSSWGCDVDLPQQYIYDHQVASGHITLHGGRQFHVRVYPGPDGHIFQAHVEWDGLAHPILHMMYAGLDYELGQKMLSEFINGSKENALEMQKEFYTTKWGKGMKKWLKY